jgi:hypothetical protein
MLHNVGWSLQHCAVAVTCFGVDITTLVTIQHKHVLGTVAAYSQRTRPSTGMYTVGCSLLVVGWCLVPVAGLIDNQ